MDQQTATALIALPEVRRISGISKSEIFRRIRRKQFPEPTRLGPRCSRWAMGEVLAWVNARLDERKAA